MGRLQDFGPFNPDKIPVEAQGWWIPNFGHVHVSMLSPFGRPVSGIYNAELRFILHNNPSTIDQLVVFVDNVIDLELDKDRSKHILQRHERASICPYDGTVSNTCVWAFPLQLDTRRWPDGWRTIDLRLQAKTLDGDNFRVTLRVIVLALNGNKRKDWMGFSDVLYSRQLRGNGWYTNADYNRAFIRFVPQKPLHGTVQFGIRATQPIDQRLVVQLDATHSVPAVGSWPEQEANAGQVLYDVSGEDNSVEVPIVIDTALLENGWHSLAARNEGLTGRTSTCDYCAGELNVPAGVAKLWFYVDNGPSGPQGEFGPVL